MWPAAEAPDHWKRLARGCAASPADWMWLALVPPDIDLPLWMESPFFDADCCPEEMEIYHGYRQGWRLVVGSK